MGVILKVENISKQYRLGLIGSGALGDDLKRWWYKFRGKEDPFLKVGELNDRSTKGDSQYVWAIKDINFEVQEGEVLGIIGKNGAGKSTLLKILSRVTGPTTGSIKTKGRIASLLEVGTGFHPELTGRENIYLNGAILGMTKAEIKSKEDEIIAFSGCERYIDTPVKRYSSGMRVRLAFAVAAFLEPDILVIDEVLAVGDAEFQKKAIGKMHDISKGDGRTVLFVSHNMAAVKSLCTRTLVLENGNIVYEGNTNNAVGYYLSVENEIVANKVWDEKCAPGNINAKITSIKIEAENNIFQIEKELKISIEFVNFIDNQVLNISVSIFNEEEIHVLATPNLNRTPLSKGKFRSTCAIPPNFLNTGKYYFTIILVGSNFEIITQLDKIISIELTEDGKNRGSFFGYWGGLVRPNLKWDNELVSS